MAASLQSFSTLRNPNPSPYRCRSRVPQAFCRLSFPSFLQLEAVPSCGLDLAQSSLSKRSPGFRLIEVERRVLRPVPFAASNEESKQSEIEVEKETDNVEIKADDSQEALKQSLEYVKAEAMKVKDMSQEAYEVYSKKAAEILLEASEKLKIQAGKAQNDLSVIAKELGEEGKEYLNTTAKNYPDSVKDILETFTSYSELKKISEVRDYHIGIPYGTSLSIGGFLLFMLTGSIPAIRFGIILGAALLALSVSSLRSWKRGQPSALNLTGQAAIASIISIRELWCFCQMRSFLTLLVVIISGGVVAFYVYLILRDTRNKGPAVEQTSEN
ncbi:protein FATTY ACID EXPORT 3, chloroplastic-like [Phoenix dactylifera]|uniref:Protein FATTY ACID EXPORT 3, chloroplastic-like n=1 Tax=Phoenix dactylifera TaxID=42345 RepID=A0A8B7C5K0_PHODC|nr:protein FATTY ACID EXPORT 3, chloroplastic-like [Phoenix dactylifera]XP_008792239.2 protein FATTY ACID EXPORT 3, chloroplastic-like [Phoenix dactylifera]XP_008792240.2 protein FATTY ACID EXPORT 3, chloroplastic-like [Phoenix dactylifera]